MAHIGIDESGKGDYFGYLVIAGVLLDENEEELKKMGVKDSKLLSDSAIHRIASDIKKICRYDIVRISPEKYNKLYDKFKSLNRLLAWGHARVMENLLKNDVDYVISDKFADERFLRESLFERGRKVKLVQKINAESDIAVAAASVLARAEFLRTLKKLSKEINYDLPKGSAHVDSAMKELVKRDGINILPKIAKLHFKITKRVLKNTKSTWL